MAGIDKVSSFSSKMMEYTSKALGKVSKSKPIKWLGDEFQKDPEKALAYTTVASIVIKDGVGCYKYVTQSLNNKEIPDERRNFVAALDLTNGVLMILAQIGMFFAMRKFSEPIFNKLFNGSFNPKNQSNVITKIRMMQKEAGETVWRKLNISKEYAKVRKDALDLFKFVADIAAATIIGKRVIVPFVATPLANIVKDKMDAKLKDNKEESKPIETNKIEAEDIDEEEDDD